MTDFVYLQSSWRDKKIDHAFWFDKLGDRIDVYQDGDLTVYLLRQKFERTSAWEQIC